MRIGNVVKWNGALYVAAGIRTAGDGDPDLCTLIPLAFSNSTSNPSRTWPSKQVYAPECLMDECDHVAGFCPYTEVPDTTKTVDTVEVVADTIEEFIMGRLKELMLGVR